MIDDLVKFCLTEVAYEGELGARYLYKSIQQRVVQIGVERQEAVGSNPPPFAMITSDPS